MAERRTSSVDVSSSLTVQPDNSVTVLLRLMATGVWLAPRGTGEQLARTVTRVVVLLFAQVAQLDRAGIL